jgi:hypothetical protein
LGVIIGICPAARSVTPGAADGEPRHWTEHHQKHEDSNGNRCQCAMAIEFRREPIEHRVERYGNDDAPDDDRQKRADQDKRPVSQKPEANDSNDEKHKLFIRCTGLQRSIIVIHC